MTVIVATPANAEGTEENTETKTPEQIEAERIAAEQAEAERLAAEGETELAVAIGADPSLGSGDEEDDKPLEDGTPAPQWAKDLRKKARDDARELRRLEQERDEALAKAAGNGVQPPAAVVVGEKPTFEGCDYDAEKFEAELMAWKDRKRAAEDAEKNRTKEQQDAIDAYAVKQGAYKTGATALKVQDFDASEKAVEAGLSKLQQSIIVKHAKNAALLVYALGKDAARLKEMGAIKDPVEFGVRLAQLESEVRTVQRPKFKPEGRVSGGGTGVPATGANALEKARAAAEKTGDMTQVLKLRREAKEAAAAKK